MQELHQRIQDGEIGDLNLMRGYRMHGPVGSAFSEKWPGEPSELLWQIKRFHSFLWASGGCFSDFYIHHIDHLCWMKNAWPVKAQALGGRHYRENFVDQNFDSYSVEYTFADGAKLYMDGRCVTGCASIYSSYAHGSKGMAIVSKASDCRLPLQHLQGAEARPREANLDLHGQEQSLRQRMAGPDESHPRRQALQRSQARRASQRRDLHGPHGRAHRPGNHL